MNTTTATLSPFASAEEFFESTGYDKIMERRTFEQHIWNALYRAGFSRSRMEHVKSHRLTIAMGRSTNDLDFRPPRRIKADIRRAFQREGLSTTPSMVTVYRAGSRLLAHVGILEPKA